jgi:hypothetical protein
VHRAVRQQCQDGGADVASATAAPPVAVPTARAARAEAESGPEARSEARSEWAARAEAEGRFADHGVYHVPMMLQMLTRVMAVPSKSEAGRATRLSA